MGHCALLHKGANEEADYNARSETMHEKPSFKFSVKSKRCLIPANSYYEWTVGEDGGKDPHNIHLPDNEPFYFAGLWAHNDHLDLTSCTIITSQAAPEIEHIHNRMPIILAKDAWEPWIDREVETDRARELIKSNRGSELVSYRVGRAVNKNTAKGAQLIEPV